MWDPNVLSFFNRCSTHNFIRQVWTSRKVLAPWGTFYIPKVVKWRLFLSWSLGSSPFEVRKEIFLAELNLLELAFQLVKRHLLMVLEKERKEKLETKKEEEQERRRTRKKKNKKEKEQERRRTRKKKNKKEEEQERRRTRKKKNKKEEEQERRRLVVVPLIHWTVNHLRKILLSPSSLSLSSLLSPLLKEERLTEGRKRKKKKDSAAEMGRRKRPSSYDAVRKVRSCRTNFSQFFLLSPLPSLLSPLSSPLSPLPSPPLSPLPFSSPLSPLLSPLSSPLQFLEVLFAKKLNFCKFTTQHNNATQQHNKQ